MSASYDNWIDGAFVAPSKRMPTTNPFTGEQWAEVADDPAAVDTAVAAARAAFEAGPWASMPGRERAGLMRRLGELLTESADDLAVIETRDNGKIIRETTAQAKSLESYLDYFAGVADKIVGQQIPSPSPDFLVYTERVPVGVVGAIIPWNSPLALLTWKLAPAAGGRMHRRDQAVRHHAGHRCAVGREGVRGGLPAGRDQRRYRRCRGRRRDHVASGNRQDHLHRGWGNGPTRGSCRGGEPDADGARTRWEVATDHLRRCRPRGRHERPSRRDLRRQRADLCRRFPCLRAP